MNNKVIKRLVEISNLQATLQHIETVEWLFKYHTSIMNSLEDVLYPLQYEINDKMFRFRVQSLIKQLLDQAKYMNMVYDFSITCDETNNTISVIDNNDFKIDIAIKPLMYIDEWIYLLFSFK